jgi:hypothetical protein
MPSLPLLSYNGSFWLFRPREKPSLEEGWKVKTRFSQQPCHGDES